MKTILNNLDYKIFRLKLLQFNINNVSAVLHCPTNKNQAILKLNSVFFKLKLSNFEIFPVFSNEN